MVTGGRGGGSLQAPLCLGKFKGILHKMESDTLWTMEMRGWWEDRKEHLPQITAIVENLCTIEKSQNKDDSRLRFSQSPCVLALGPCKCFLSTLGVLSTTDVYFSQPWSLGALRSELAQVGPVSPSIAVQKNLS